MELNAGERIFVEESLKTGALHPYASVRDIVHWLLMARVARADTSVLFTPQGVRKAYEELTAAVERIKKPGFYTDPSLPEYDAGGKRI